MTVYNHTGIVVTDLERSKRFYQDVLGFQFWFEITPPDDATAKLSSLEPPLGVTASYLILDGFVLEFLHYSAPGAIKPFRARTMDEPGLTHLSIAVDEFKRRTIEDAVRRHGGNWAAAARELGLHRANLHNLALRLGLKRAGQV